MNIQSKTPTTADEFLRWNEGREGKREFVRGRVVEMMIDVTRNHAEICANVMQSLRTQLDRKAFTVGSADFAVRTPNGIRFPDVFVDRKKPVSGGTDLTATEPVVLVEVLSPSSFARDFVEKMADYRGIDSLLHYLIFSHQERRVWVSSKEGAQWNDPREFFGADEIVRLPEFDVALALADIYDGVDV